MSKVHEALKRAMEERSLIAQQSEGETGKSAVEAVPGAVSPLPANPANAQRSTATQQGNSRNDARGMEGAAAAAAPATVNPAVLSKPPATVPPPTFVAPTVEHLPHASAVGRDPRTGQFLRFEDLLKNCAKPAWVLDPRTVVFCESNRQIAGTEQFRTLRTRLYHLRETAPLKKILITSALAGEGKTFVATNLAQAIARERDRRVLLIDADLRNPTLHLPLGAPLAPGLSEYLREQASDADIIQHGCEGNLCFIAAGQPGSDPSELLSNGGLEKLLDRVAPLFDWVIVDSPPCLPVADANVLAGLCDGAVLVIRARSTPSAAVERARKELQKRKVVGVVMNGVEEDHGYGAYYAGYGHPLPQPKASSPVDRLVQIVGGK